MAATPAISPWGCDEGLVTTLKTKTAASRRNCTSSNSRTKSDPRLADPLASNQVAATAKMKIGMDKTCAQFSGPPANRRCCGEHKVSGDVCGGDVTKHEEPCKIDHSCDHAEQWRQPFLQLRQFESMVSRLGLQA